MNAVTIEKDVDGFHPLNIGHLIMQGREPLFVPCTPKGCMELLHRHRVQIKGRRAVVIGRSNIVGMPVALLLQVKSVFILWFLVYSLIVYFMLVFYGIFDCRGRMPQLALYIRIPRILKKSQDKLIL